MTVNVAITASAVRPGSEGNLIVASITEAPARGAGETDTGCADRGMFSRSAANLLGRDLRRWQAARCSAQTQVRSDTSCSILALRAREASAYAGTHKDKNSKAVMPERQSSTIATNRKASDPARTTKVEMG
jgi:hypothetical protein